MTHYCLDACSIINLFCGWGCIQELHSFGTSWSTTTTALDEFKEVRVQQADGTIVRNPIDQRMLFLQYPLIIHAELTQDELTTATDLSEEIDDGEAECIAVAHHRSLVFVSDDGPAIAAATRLDVSTASSLDLISEWADKKSLPPSDLADILVRIETLARYVPPRNHTRRNWWNDLRCQRD